MAKKKKRNKRDKAPEITKELLLTRQGAMAQQQERMLIDVAKVQGALQFCQALLNVLDGTEPATQGDPRMPSQEDMERMRAEGRAAQKAIDKKLKAKAKRATTKAKRKPNPPTPPAPSE